VKPQTCITTSWDDGHPLDLRVADLLARYGLRGTFYVPRDAENGTLTNGQIRELSVAFEVGAHTLHEVDLTGTTEAQAWEEIATSRSWVEDTTGLPCRMFCPPKGRFSRRELRLIRKAGYGGLRSVELSSLDFPRRQEGLLLMPTTVQAHPHRWLTYARNAIRRASLRNLLWCLPLGGPTDWTRRARTLLTHALERGGVFHLWGHSWEVERTGQWQRLEEVLRFLAQFLDRAPALTNGEVCQTVSATPVGGPVS
jgi:peptidoglycan/xylan/chitin deacetylase (PgdA/CDA1 family)